MGANKENAYSRIIANELAGIGKDLTDIKEQLKVIAHNQLPTVATPVIALSSNKAAITCATSGAVIHYTTDGTEPTADSAVYSEPLSIAASPITIKAIAMKLDCHDSAVASKVFTIVAKPVIGLNAETGKIEMSCATDGATIYYTDDDSDPTSASTAYTAGIAQPVSETTYKAIAIKEGMVDSAIETFTFTPIVATPVIGLNAETGKIEMSCTTDDASIYYTTDGTDPTSASTAYTAGIDQPADETTFKAIAIKSGMADSAIESYTFTPTQA